LARICLPAEPYVRKTLPQDHVMERRAMIAHCRAR
jgi:hypothetical protein